MKEQVKDDSRNVRSYNTNLAAEFHVLSMLYRLGFDASLTLGNKKSVDIAVVLEAGRAITIDVKGLAGPNDWLMGGVPISPKANHFVVLLTFGGKMSDGTHAAALLGFPARRNSAACEDKQKPNQQTADEIRFSQGSSDQLRSSGSSLASARRITASMIR